jgi:hypothetical protein
MTPAPPAPPPEPGTPSAPAPGAPPPEPPAPPAASDDSPSREDVIRDPQALLDVLSTTRDENRRMNRRLRDFERAERDRSDAAKTELERATDRATTAETALGDAQLGALRLEVALEQLLGDNPAVKMAMNLAPRLRGSTREELAQDAAQMRTLLGQQPPANGHHPPPDPYGGGTRLGSGTGQPGTDASFNQAIRRAAGRG